MASIKFSEIVKPFSYVEASGDFEKWLAKVRVVAKLQKVNDLAGFIQLFLTGQAFDVYCQLSCVKQEDQVELIKALGEAFSQNQFSAYETLQGRKLQKGESVDAFVADLKRLLTLSGSGDPPEQLIKSALVIGLPQAVRAQLLAMSDATMLPLGDLVVRARTALSVNGESESVCAAGRRGAVGVRCYRCNQPGHRAGECKVSLHVGRPGSDDRRQDYSGVKCFSCGKLGHISRFCPDRFHQGRVQRPETGSGNGGGVPLLVQEAAPEQN